MLTKDWKCIFANNAKESKMIQEVLETLGFTGVVTCDELYIVVNSDMKFNVNCKDCGYKRITLDQITQYLSREPDFVEVKLNAKNTARVYKDKVVFGIHEFSLTALDDLVNAINSTRNNKNKK